MNRRAFISKLKRRFSLRLHMTLILLATAMAGVVASKLLLIAGLENPAIRYPLTVIFAYGVFFIAIKFWLWIVIGSAAAQTSISGASMPDISSTPLPDDASSAVSDVAFSGGGGKFSGGGASGSFGEPVTPPSGGSMSGGSSSGGSGSFDIDLDDGIGVIIVLILLALLLIAVFGVGAYLIYQAPAILSEIAFDSVLAVSLVRKSKKMQDPDWIGSVFKATWKQFAIILLFALIAGIAIHVIFPDMTKLSDIYRIVSSMDK
jgi:hypothetical protein